MFHGPIANRLALTKVLLEPGGEKLSFETAQFCAELLMEKAPYYRGDKSEAREFPRDSPQGIVKSLNHGHSVNQGLIRDQAKMRQEYNLKLRNAFVLAVVSWVPAIAAFVLALLKFL